MSSWASDSSGTRTFFDQGLFLLHLNRGKEEMRRGQYDSARREFEAAQQFRPHDPDVVSNLSFSLFHLGNYEDAERITRELLTSHSDSVPLLFNLGLILFKTERHSEAREPLERVLEIVPAHRKSHLTLGLIFQRAGDLAEAKRHFRLAGAELKEGSMADDTISRSARTAVASRKLSETSPIVKPETLESEPPVPAASDARPREGVTEPAPVPATRTEPPSSPSSEREQYETGAVPALPQQASSDERYQTGVVSGIPDASAEADDHHEPESPPSTQVVPPSSDGKTGPIPVVTQRLRARALAAKKSDTDKIPVVTQKLRTQMLASLAEKPEPNEVSGAVVEPAIEPRVEPLSRAPGPAPASVRAAPEASPKTSARREPVPDVARRESMSLSAPETFRMEAGGFLGANCARGLFVRRGVLSGREGAPSFEADRQLGGALSQLLIRASGPGELLLVDRARRPFLKTLSDEFLSVEPGRLLAFEASLRYREDPAFEFRRHIPVPFLKLFGNGTVALSVLSEPALFPVSAGKPLTLAARAVLAYGGDVVPDLLEESDPLASLGSGPVFRFVGTGYVLAEAG